MLFENNIKITDDDIEYAEEILLKNGEHFDVERRDFIKNLDTIDLQAVPGSGKTTALLAKLLILERKMPFSNGCGILVLSHTNTAVDEIKERLERIAPKLFKFPNFIGTIQSFVDEFLAKPYGINYLGINFTHIDSDYYNSRIEYFYNGLGKYSKIKGYIDQNHKPLEFLQDIILDEFNNLAKGLGGDFWLKCTSESPSYEKVYELKNELKKQGIISFNEAYYHGGLYLEKFPKIIKILQKRFQFVFVDEMQDMGAHQVEILENIFYHEGDTTTVFQRVGDSNQAIYDGKVELNNIWRSRDDITRDDTKKLLITGTHRLTKSVAAVVKHFGIEYIEFDGKRVLKNLNQIEQNIKPILLVYKTEHLNTDAKGGDRILSAFSALIKQKKMEGLFQDIEDDSKFICKAIIWNAKPQLDQQGKDKFDISVCRAKHYYHNYDVIGGKSRNKTWFKTDKDYLFYYDKADNSLKSKNKNIMNLFLRILRVNNINDGTKYFTRSSFFEFLKQKNEMQHLEFKSKIYAWCKRLNDSNIDIIAEEMDEYFFSDFIVMIFGKTLYKSIALSQISSNIAISGNVKETNIYTNEDNIRIQVSTIHSVKGETHTCTLYLESSNSGYESTEKIKIRSFLGEGFGGTLIQGKQAMKMLYVGLSRPTHLLCYAIHEDRYDKLISGTGSREKLEELWHVETMI